jgi:hypothetical protein
MKDDSFAWDVGGAVKARMPTRAERLYGGILDFYSIITDVISDEEVM